MSDEFNENWPADAPYHWCLDAEWCLRCLEAEDRWGRCSCARERDEVHGPPPFIPYVAPWLGCDGETETLVVGPRE